MGHTHRRSFRRRSTDDELCSGRQTQGPGQREQGCTSRLFDEGIVSGAGELLAHGLGIVAAGEWTYLYMEQFVLRFSADGWGEAILAQGIGESFGVGAILDGGYLHHDA